MISTTQLLAMNISVVITVILPLILCLFLFIKKKIKAWPFFVGFGLAIITQMLITPSIALFTQKLGLSQLMYLLICGILGGAMEEVIRIIFFFGMRKRRKANDSIGLGLGQSVTITLLTGFILFSYVMSAKAINAGTVEQVYGVGEQVTLMVETLSALPWSYYLLTSLDCIINVALYCLYSVMILMGFRKNEKRYFYNAILIHASIASMGTALSSISIVFKEVYMLVCLGIALYLILPMYKELRNEDKIQEALEVKRALEEANALENNN